jgi:hypothetical protein
MEGGAGEVGEEEDKAHVVRDSNGLDRTITYMSVNRL